MAPDHFVFGLCFRAATKKFARRAKIGVVRSQTHGMARGDQLYRRTPREKGKDVKIAPLSPGSSDILATTPVFFDRTLE
jgi:hypothetical protein